MSDTSTSDIDVQYLLDWATDVGGDNYRPSLQECEDVLTKVLGNAVLHAECEHVRNETFCDPLCDAYVPGCGHFKVWPKENNDE